MYQLAAIFYFGQDKEISIVQTTYSNIKNANTLNIHF